MRNVLNAVGYAVVAFLVLALAGAQPAPAAAGRDQFDGKWTVTVTPDDGGKPYEDTLTFKGGKFLSEKCKAHGFEEAEYDADVRGGQIATFTATAKSKREGSAKWTGTAAATQLQGTFKWTKADGSTADYSYTGARSEKK
jgi:hypothetical protein